jgi:hypothetical protein
LAQQPRAPPNQRLWALTILGEIAIRRDDPAAEQYLQEALALDSRDVYALTVSADYLLDHGRAAEVLRLLRGFERVDALYLRLALAAQATGDPGFIGYRNDVAARFEAARRQVTRCTCATPRGSRWKSSMTARAPSIWRGRTGRCTRPPTMRACCSPRRSLAAIRQQLGRSSNGSSRPAWKTVSSRT